MKHLMIFFLILSLIVGTGVIIYTFQFYKKYKYRFLKSLFIYLIFFNLFIIIGLSYQYILVNIFDNNFDQVPTITSLMLFFFVVGAEFGITYSIFRVTSDLKEVAISKIYNTLFIIWVSVFGSATLIGTIIYVQESTYELLYVIHELWILSMITIIPALFINLIIFAFKKPRWDNPKRKSVLIFAGYFLVGYLFFAISNLDFYFFQFNIDDYDPILFLILNIWPLLWILFYFNKYHNDGLSKTADHENLDELFSEFKISERESEIIELIIKGKSNKEIEQILFISFNTVKNHIYNIYKKLGVSSRSQLIHIVQQFTRES
ncbi:LuxR C-terminal-related transcriptional regulator [Bacteroidota bacterium]